jgi:hypothetical protein
MGTRIIEVPINEIVNDLFCGKCNSVIYGYDEIICPVCGTRINMDWPKIMTEKDFWKKVDKDKFMM